MSHRGKPFPSPILCYVTDRKCLVSEAAGDGCDLLLKRIAAAASAGVDWIQIREKDLSGKEYSLLTREALLQTKRSTQGGGNAARILVNDRLDVALTEHASGVHLGERSLPVQEVRKGIAATPGHSAGDTFLVGVSCHSVEGAMSAARAGADYIFFGPIFTTPSKAAFGAPQGLPLLAEICRSVTIPVLAIGGITLENGTRLYCRGGRRHRRHSTFPERRSSGVSHRQTSRQFPLRSLIPHGYHMRINFEHVAALVAHLDGIGVGHQFFSFQLVDNFRFCLIFQFSRMCRIPD